MYSNHIQILNGCDSIVILDLTVNYSSIDTLEIATCDSYDWDGIIYDTTGIHTNYYTDINGCDSTVTLDLTINYSTITNTNRNSCNYFDWDGILYDTTGIYSNYYQDVNGCDSIVILNLTIHYSSIDTLNISTCDSIIWDGITYSSTGIYTNLYTDINGCDSAVTLNLSISNSTELTLTQTSCDNFLWDGVVYDSTGIYTNIYSNINGCDSSVTLDLTVNYSSTNNISVIACDSYDWDGVTYSNTGVYTNIYTIYITCDSTVVLDLNIVACIPFSPSVDIVLSNTDCDSLSDLTITVLQDSLEIDMDSALFVSDGGYFNLLSLSIGDNIGNAIMSFGPTSINADLIVETIISSEKVVLQAIDPISGLVLGDFTISNNLGGGISIFALSVNDGNNFTAYGNSSSVTIYNLFTNPNQGLLNFVSTIISELNDVDVQIFTETISCICTTVYTNISIVACDNYMWNGLVLDSSLVNYDTLTTMLGCDSIIVLDLTIHYSSINNLNVSSCDSYEWDGVSYYSSGSYTNLYTDLNGCDSTVILNLIINNSSINNINATSCDSYSWDGLCMTPQGYILIFIMDQMDVTVLLF